MTPTTEELVAEAVRLACENADAGQSPFGALVVRNGTILGRGVNTTLRDSDPTAHAEVAAIRAARDADLTGGMVVSSCEPCPMCQAVAALVGMSRILFAASSGQAAEAGFELGPAAAARASALRDAGTLPLEHVPVPDAVKPFARFAASGATGAANPVRELRIALTVEDFEQAVGFYRDVLGLPVRLAWDESTGRGAILEAGVGTLELLDPAQAALIDEIEVGRRVAGPIRLALGVDDSEQTAERLTAGGADLIAPATVTPWRDRNARVQAPDGMQLTLFTSLED